MKIFKCPTSSSVMLTDAYLAALNIPRFKCDRGDKEQLKMHLLCSMLCCPKQIRDDETVSAETVNANMCDVSRNYLNFYTVGRVATNEDRVEMNRISKNLVDWQSVQRRYQEMFNEDSEDKELMEFYKRKYGLEFRYSSLNGDQQRIFDMNEPQYIPTSGDIINLSASEPESEESMSLEGVYTDDEEHDNSMPTKIPEKNATTTGSEQNKYDGLKRELPPRRSPIRSFPVKPYYAGETQPEHAKDYVEPFRNPWEIGEDEMPTQNKNTGKQQKHSPSATRGIKTQAESLERPQSLPRHLSAFASCKSRTNSSKRDSEVRKVAQERNSPAIETEMQTPRRDLYERRGDEQSRQVANFFTLIVLLGKFHDGGLSSP
ncbi:hypothetical protein NECAME_00177 [Necator americanus]|uniref:Uncharacterized protein n=1 Tax=Necator americanus TaxID=51031 RepID=W2TLE0_NECAM|nr:hypothetical protein NECAME_00177 [Necator americanus]ETN81827.1 hypothetical protein NECAME_00177 [Necator americanus]